MILDSSSPTDGSRPTWPRPHVIGGIVAVEGNILENARVTEPDGSQSAAVWLGGRTERSVQRAIIGALGVIGRNSSPTRLHRRNPSNRAAITNDRSLDRVRCALSSHLPSHRENRPRARRLRSRGPCTTPLRTF
jgi:hypothetical protein